jgi:PTS system mannose-specific IIA component
VIVSHGDLADGLVDAARMIAGELEGIATVSLREMDAVEGLVERVAAAIQAVDSGDGVVVLVDLFGASPFNASARLALQGDSKMEVISGMSLPMLLDLVVERDGKTLEQLVEIAQEAGTSGINTLSETLALKTGL